MYFGTLNHDLVNIFRPRLVEYPNPLRRAVHPVQSRIFAIVIRLTNWNFRLDQRLDGFPQQFVFAGRCRITLQLQSAATIWATKQLARRRTSEFQLRLAAGAGVFPAQVFRVLIGHRFGVLQMISLRPARLLHSLPLENPSSETRWRMSLNLYCLHPENTIQASDHNDWETFSGRF